MTNWKNFWKYEGKDEYNAKYMKIQFSITRDIEKLINKHHYKTVLDLGCGPAIIIKELSKKYPTKQFIGYDLSYFIIKENKKVKIKNLKFKVINLDKVLTKQKFDCVLCLSVLHYFKNPLQKIKEIMNIVNKRGSLIINYPNKRLLKFEKKKRENISYWKRRWKYMFQEKNLITFSKIKGLGYECKIIRKKIPYNLYVQIIKT